VEEISAAVSHKKANDVSTISMSVDISKLSAHQLGLALAHCSSAYWVPFELAGRQQR
jgi:hypothetical protein